MKILVNNKSAYHKFEIGDKFEAGIVLVGTEVKSLRKSKASFADSYATCEKDEIFLHNLNIQPYSHGNINNHEAERKRKLLLSKSEIFRLKKKIEEKGYTIVPLSIYSGSNGWIKVEIGVGRGKNLYDKRRDKADKESKRRIEKVLKNRGRDF